MKQERTDKPTYAALRKRAFGKLRATGVTDREDRLLLLNNMLYELFPQVQGKITSLNEMTYEELELTVRALSCWELVQEARLYAGVLHVDNEVASLSHAYKQAHELEHTAHAQAVQRSQETL